MSIVHYHTCDHCGKCLDSMKDYEDYNLSEFLRVDLCADCLKEFEKIINKFLNREGKNEHFQKH